MKTYVLTISKSFPSTHSKKAMPTNFFENILKGEKKHTIRGNYDLWKKRIDEVNEGIAIISLREWSGVPYKSKQVELSTFKKGDVHIQKLSFHILYGILIDGRSYTTTVRGLAKNDGLRSHEFIEWFEGINYSDKLAIIHFNKFTPYFKY